MKIGVPVVCMEVLRKILKDVRNEALPEDLTEVYGMMATMTVAIMENI